MLQLKPIVLLTCILSILLHRVDSGLLMGDLEIEADKETRYNTVSRDQVEFENEMRYRYQCNHSRSYISENQPKPTEDCSFQGTDQTLEDGFLCEADKGRSPSGAAELGLEMTVDIQMPSVLDTRAGSKYFDPDIETSQPAKSLMALGRRRRWHLRNFAERFNDVLRRILASAFLL